MCAYPRSCVQLGAGFVCSYGYLTAGSPHPALPSFQSVLALLFFAAAPACSTRRNWVLPADGHFSSYLLFHMDILTNASKFGLPLCEASLLASALSEMAVYSCSVSCPRQITPGARPVVAMAAYFP